MDLCLNSVVLETLNINEIFFLNCSKHIVYSLPCSEQVAQQKPLQTQNPIPQ